MENTRLTVTLNSDEINALISIAQKEFRHPRDQAKLILISFLEDQGFLLPTQIYPEPK